MTKIIPTVGRRLYMYFLPSEVIAYCYDMRHVTLDQPIDAGILYVHADGTINIMATDHYGTQRFFERVVLVENPTETNNDYWCQWMPYQIKAEAERVAKEPVT